MREISNADNVIDSRDIIARVDELKDQYIDCLNGEDGAEWTDDDYQELITLEEFSTEGANSTRDWHHGATLIRDSHFEEYIRDYVGDTDWEALSALPGYLVIDWEATARDLQTDYTPVDFDGVTYWVR